MKTINFAKYLMLGAAAMLLSSCHIYQKYDLARESEGSTISSDYMKAVAAQPDSASLPYLGWEKVFTDPLLQGYIRTALANNSDLENARLNVDIARAQLKGAKLSYFPSVALNPNGGAASYGGSHMNWTYTIPAAVTWEIDVFAKILNRKRGAQVGVDQARDYLQAAQSQIVCGVASTYYAIVLLNQQLELTKRTADIWKDQVATMELMKQAGRTNEAAVVQSRAQYYSILATIPDLEQQLATTHNALSLLLKKYPGDRWQVTSNLDFSIPTELGSGVPMTYLATRPDVRAAERALAVAYYSTNSARAAFYPTLAISPTGGLTNSVGGLVVNPAQWFIQLAGQLTAPLFSRGQNIANLEVAKANQKIALNKFETSVLGASRDVADALMQYHKNAEKREQVELQIDQLEKSVVYTQELFMYNQNTSYLEVLTARSGLLNAQLASLACWHNKVAALISLYQAVGGGR